MEMKMTEQEFQGYLSRYRMTVSELSHFIFLHSGTLIMPQSISKHLSTYGHLSKNLTASVRLAFKLKEVQHGQRV